MVCHPDEARSRRLIRRAERDNLSVIPKGRAVAGNRLKNMTELLERYRPELVDPETMGEWLRWSLDFFTQPVLQMPYLDITLQLDVTTEYQRYQAEKSGAGASFFAFMLWHLAQTLAAEPSANLRLIDGKWYRLHNPPIFVPVALGGEARFGSLVLDDVYRQDYPEFLDNYQQRLAAVRAKRGEEPMSDLVFRCAHFIGNLPYLRFTGLNLHWRADQMVGQSCFYFGQRYAEGARLMQPLAAKLHHACMDPLILNNLITAFKQRFQG